MQIDVLYEDSDIVAINKPAGLMVHSDGREFRSENLEFRDDTQAEEFRIENSVPRDTYNKFRNKEQPRKDNDFRTVAGWFIDRYPDSKNVGEAPIETAQGVVIERPGIVHRLDKDTSGVMLLAKTDRGHAQLKEQFQNRSIKKTYRAWVYGEIKDDEGLIDAPIGRSKTFAKWTAIPKALRGAAREAKTTWQVIRRVGGFSELHLYPATGRTHQIRVHLQYKNYPIVADALYAGKRFELENPAQNLGFTRQALHAQSITFTDCDGQEKTIQAPLPTDFQEAEQYLS